MTNKIVIAATNNGFILSEDDIALLRALDDGSLQITVILILHMVLYLDIIKL